MQLYLCEQRSAELSPQHLQRQVKYVFLLSFPGEPTVFSFKAIINTLEFIFHLFLLTLYLLWNYLIKLH